MTKNNKNMDLIKHHSRVIAKAIMERHILDIDEVSALIENRILDALNELICDKATREQQLYDEKLKEISRYKLGSPQYIEMGYQLSKIKRRKALANKAANEVGQNIKYHRLKDFVNEKFGRDSLNEFFNNPENITTHG